MTKRRAKTQAKGWTKERREAAAARCRANKPWKHATGPKTKAGKMRSSLNALKHGERSCNLDNARHMLRLNREFVRCFTTFYMVDRARIDLSNELIKTKAQTALNFLINNNSTAEQGGGGPKNQQPN